MSSPSIFQYTLNDSLGLYIHVPFCGSKCGYCDFFSVVPEDDTLVHMVIDETIRQAGFHLEKMNHPAIDTLYIGGGTPSSIGRENLEKLLRFICELKEAAGIQEFTVEANPETLTPGFLSLLREYEVTRLSLGVQSLSSQALSFLERACNRERVMKSLALISKEWRKEWNADLILNIPGHSVTDTLKEIDIVLDHGCRHLSLYDLTYEPGTSLGDAYRAEIGEHFADADNDDVYQPSLHTLIERLNQKGFRRYEISNYAIPGYESLHNIRYWHMRPYLGAGPGAVSTLPGNSGALRMENPKNIQLYLQGEDSGWGADMEILTAEEFLLEHLMMGFRLTEGISIKRIEKIFEIPFFSIAPRTFKSWESRGRARRREGYYSLSHEGLLFLDSFLKETAVELSTGKLFYPSRY